MNPFVLTILFWVHFAVHAQISSSRQKQLDHFVTNLDLDAAHHCMNAFLSLKRTDKDQLDMGKCQEFIAEQKRLQTFIRKEGTTEFTTRVQSNLLQVENYIQKQEAKSKRLSNR